MLLKPLLLLAVFLGSFANAYPSMLKKGARFYRDAILIGSGVGAGVAIYKGKDEIRKNIKSDPFYALEVAKAGVLVGGCYGAQAVAIAPVGIPQEIARSCGLINSSCKIATNNAYITRLSKNGTKMLCEAGIDIDSTPAFDPKNQAPGLTVRERSEK